MSHVFVDETPDLAAHWRLVCDRPGCGRFASGVGRTDNDQRRFATAQAESRGYQLSRHGDVRLDFCPEHIDHTRSVSLAITRLYDEHGKPVPYKGARR